MYAHTAPDTRTQDLRDHLDAVAALAKSFAAEFGCGEWGELAGLTHDIGKYFPAFQRYLTEGGPKTEHAAAGAIALCSRYLELSYCIAGHHAGLPDGGDIRNDPVDMPTLGGKLKRGAKFGWDIPACLRALEIPPAGNLPLPPIDPMGRKGFPRAFLIRMLFSCLVDADFLDTEAFMNDAPFRPGFGLNLPALFPMLEKELDKFRNPKGDISKKRCEILSRCIEAAQWERGLYTLTVPTGGGKTLSSLAFAHYHALAHTGREGERDMRRIIYVIPYVSIIEQTAKIFEDIYGEDNVLAHHSGVNYDDMAEDKRSMYRLASENWDMPVIVTTGVQFFESLFANKASRCRKLHNIANSVIIFDEAQMLPVPYLRPCVRAIAELVKNYGCTAVLCTATQPSLDKLFPEGMLPKEICPDTGALYAFFRRTRFVNDGAVTPEKLAEALNAQNQALCVLNKRDTTQRLFQLLKKEGCFHLSTLMYPVQRKRTLDAIRGRLKSGLPCRVVSTSLVEAGVDLDFPAAYRELAGLDSIIQAGGRCNREGKHPLEESLVHVFTLEGTKTPQNMRLNAEVAQIVMRDYAADIASPESIAAYFNQLHYLRGQSALDQKDILRAFEKDYPSLPFAWAAEQVKLIDEPTRQILIPLEEQARQDAAQLYAGVRNRALMRRVGQYSVSVRPSEYEALLAAGAIRAVDSELAVLEDLSAYSPEVGLSVPKLGIGVFA